ncbi:MAG TPA: putative sugar nucleotidyl transferase, partial [Chlamydiales bacterium]|nr:putative sugar nucleotidyl transferase [Chlamydiales bacterium]
MDKIIFTEEFCQPENLSPFTLTRQLQDIRVGILTIREKWEKMLDLPSFDRKEDDYKDLGRSVNLDEAVEDCDCFMIHGNVLPTPKLVKALQKLKNGEFISANGTDGILFRFGRKEISEKHKIRVTKSVAVHQDSKVIHYPWDILKLNDWAIRQDFELLTKKRRSQAISKTNSVTKASAVFIEKGAK